MGPPLPADDPTDVLLAYVEYLGKFSLRKLAGCVKMADLENLGIREFSVAVLHSSWLTPLLDAVIYVFLVGPKE